MTPDFWTDGYAEDADDEAVDDPVDEPNTHEEMEDE